MKSNVIGLIAIILLILLSACNEVDNRTKQDKPGIPVKVTIPSGYIYPSFDRISMPTFFNIATFEGKTNNPSKILIYNQKLNKGDKVKVNPVAMFSFVKNKIPHKYIVAKSAQDSIDNNDAFNYFMTYEFEVKSVLESWFKAQCDLGECNGFEWSNAYKAYLDLDDKNMIEKG